MLNLLNLLAAVALLVWGTHIVRTGILRIWGGDLRRLLRESVANRYAAFAAGLGITVRTDVDLPPALKRLDERHGLPSLPHVDLCLHTAAVPSSKALTHLRQAVMEQARTHLGRRGQREKD